MFGRKTSSVQHAQMCNLAIRNCQNQDHERRNSLRKRAKNENNQHPHNSLQRPPDTSETTKPAPQAEHLHPRQALIDPHPSQHNRTMHSHSKCPHVLHSILGVQKPCLHLYTRLLVHPTPVFSLLRPVLALRCVLAPSHDQQHRNSTRRASLGRGFADCLIEPEYRGCFAVW